MSNVFLSLSRLIVKINRRDKVINFFIHSLELAVCQTRCRTTWFTLIHIRGFVLLVEGNRQRPQDTGRPPPSRSISLIHTALTREWASVVERTERRDLPQHILATRICTPDSCVRNKNYLDVKTIKKYLQFLFFSLFFYHAICRDNGDDTCDRCRKES